MRDMLPPLFQIFTGLGFLLVLLVGTLCRPAIQTLSGRLIAFALLALPVASFCFSRATAATSIGAGSEMFIAGGACILVAGLLIVAGLFVQMRSAGQ
jgi:hypothetical protein